MVIEALEVAIPGFIVVFLVLFLLSLSVKCMSFVTRKIEKKGGK